MIIQILQVGCYETNCYIVGSEKTKQGLVIDPGDEPQSILKSIDDANLSIKVIVITHRHIDHIGATTAIRNATKAKLALYSPEVEDIRQSVGQTFDNIMAGLHGKLEKPELPLKDGDIINIGDLDFKVLFTPGHSPDGISVFGHGVVFSGDTLFNCGIGRTDFPGCSHTQLIKSIKEKLFTLPDDTLVYPGHGTSTTIGQEKRGNPFLR